eukprot:350862-Prorocentrum_minimum.AAC.1
MTRLPQTSQMLGIPPPGQTALARHRDASTHDDDAETDPIARRRALLETAQDGQEAIAEDSKARMKRLQKELK